jgi:putative SOS response-associated peptidase YedK
MARPRSLIVSMEWTHAGRGHDCRNKCAELHNRMPVVLKPETWPLWLGEQPAGVPQLKALLAPYPSDEMICWPVSTRVGSVKNNDPSLIEPLATVG